MHKSMGITLHLGWTWWNVSNVDPSGLAQVGIILISHQLNQLHLSFCVLN